MSDVTIRKFMSKVLADAPLLPAILLAERAMDHFGFADGTDESSLCYDLAFEMKARKGDS